MLFFYDKVVFVGFAEGECRRLGALGVNRGNRALVKPYKLLRHPSASIGKAYLGKITTTAKRSYSDIGKSFG